MLTRTTLTAAGLLLTCLMGASHAQPAMTVQDTAASENGRPADVTDQHPIEFTSHPEDEDILSRIDATTAGYHAAVDDMAFYARCARRDDEYGKVCARERDGASARIQPLKDRMVVLERLRADRAMARIEASRTAQATDH